MMQITVHYQLSPAELERGLKQVARKRRQLVAALIPLVALGGAFDVSTGQPDLGVLAIVLAVFWTYSLAAGPRIVASKAATRQCLPTEVTFTPEGYVLRNPIITIDTRWQMLDAMQETGDFFLFFTGARRATPVPKRAFTAEQAAELSAFLPGAPLSSSLPLSEELLTIRGAQ
jgi:hypothetical protein